MKAQLEVIPHKINSTIHAFRYHEKCFDAPWHYHNELELTYITQSSGVRYVGSHIGSFQVGDLVLIGPSLPHAWRNAPNYTQGASSICVQWKANELPLFSQIPEFGAVKQLLQKANFGIRFNTSKQVNKIGEQLKELPLREGAQRILSFFEIVCDLARLKDMELLSEPGKQLYNYQDTDQRIKKIFVFIDQHYGSKIGIDHMADLTHMTRSSFCKFFKQRFGKTFTQYLNEFRVHNICHKLQNTNTPVSQIAMECGYENLSYFHRQFRGIINMTPANYRSRYQQIQD